MSEEHQHSTISELEELLSNDYDVQILPNGTVTATNDRPIEKRELLMFRTNIPFSY